MARRRMIDPNFWESEDVSKLTYFERLLLIGLFSNADDYGKGRGNPATIRSRIFPNDDIPVKTIENAIDKISELIHINFYIVDENRYYKFINWISWQRVDKPQKSLLPEPHTDSKNNSKNDSENDSCLKEVKGKEVKRREVKGKERKEKEKEKTFDSFFQHFNSEIQDKIKEFIKFRSEIGKPFKSEISFQAWVKKLESFDEDDRIEILDNSIANGWQGIFSLKDKPKSKVAVKERTEVDYNKIKFEGG